MEEFDYTDSLDLKKTSEGVHPMTENPEDAIARTEAGKKEIYLYEHKTDNIMDLESDNVDSVVADRNTNAVASGTKVSVKKTVLPLTGTVVSSKKVVAKPIGKTVKRVNVLDKATNAVFKIIFNKK